MYNAARKEEYLSTISNDNSKKFMYRIFLAAAEFEYMSDKDLCNFNNGEALYFVEEATSTGDCSSYISLIKTYSNWCIEKGFCYRNGWREFKSSEVDKRKKYHTSYIRNMDEFEEMLSVVFIRDADFNETTETAKELIIRLCFLGMENNEIMHLKKNMIDFENAVIYSPIYSDSIYEVSDKILKLCKYCIAQSEERYNIKNGKTRTERLCENEYVFRQRIGTLKKNDENRPINDTLVIRRIQEFNKKYSEKTGIVKKITAEKLRKSGLFCEIQKAEDKNDYIYNEIKKQIYKKHPDITHRQLYERVKTIKEEYSIWVKSFEYTGFEFSPLYAYAKTTDIFEKITLLWKEEKKRAERNSSQVVRNLVLVKKMKKAYGCRCQLCREGEYFDILSDSGDLYCEVHHIIPLSEDEREDEILDYPGNMIIVCPNHHRYLHYNKGGSYRLTIENEKLYLKNTADKIQVQNDQHLKKYAFEQK